MSLIGDQLLDIDETQDELMNDYKNKWEVDNVKIVSSINDRIKLFKRIILNLIIIKILDS
jgi:hypothetical protein